MPLPPVQTPHPTTDTTTTSAMLSSTVSPQPRGAIYFFDNSTSTSGGDWPKAEIYALLAIVSLITLGLGVYCCFCRNRNTPRPVAFELDDWQADPAPTPEQGDAALRARALGQESGNESRTAAGVHEDPEVAAEMRRSPPPPTTVSTAIQTSPQEQSLRLSPKNEDGDSSRGNTPVVSSMSSDVDDDRQSFGQATPRGAHLSLGDSFTALSPQQQRPPSAFAQAEWGHRQHPVHSNALSLRSTLLPVASASPSQRFGVQVSTKHHVDPDNLYKALAHYNWSGVEHALHAAKDHFAQAFPNIKERLVALSEATSNALEIRDTDERSDSLQDQSLSVKKKVEELPDHIDSASAENTFGQVATIVQNFSNIRNTNMKQTSSLDDVQFEFSQAGTNFLEGKINSFIQYFNAFS